MKISLSILDFDLTSLNQELKDLYPYIDYLHMDVMDGHFVPNISFGAPLIKSLRDKTNIFFDTHLMISDPLKYVDDFIEAGSNSITFHVESSSNILDTINKIKKANVKVGLSIKPNTSIDILYPYLELLDYVLVMSVEPGFGGQAFIDSVLTKLEKLKELQSKYHYELMVDGGVNLSIVPKLIGLADIIVVGSAISKSENRLKVLKEIKSIIN